MFHQGVSQCLCFVNERRELESCWVQTQLILRVIYGETSQRICQGVPNGGEVLGLRYDSKIVGENDTSRVRVDRLVIGEDVKQKRSEGTALWHAVLLGSPSTALLPKTTNNHLFCSNVLMVVTSWWSLVS